MSKSKKATAKKNTDKALDIPEGLKRKATPKKAAAKKITDVKAKDTRRASLAKVAEATAPKPSEKSTKGRIKQMSIDPQDFIKKAGETSKVYAAIEALNTKEGARIDELAKILSKKGATVKDSQVKSWVSYDVCKLHGYGVKSKFDDDGVLRIWLIQPKVAKKVVVEDEKKAA